MKKLNGIAILLSFLLFTVASNSAIRIVSYNVYFGQIREGFYDIIEEIGRTERNGMAKPIDILLLQEFTSVSTVNSIRDQLNLIYAGDDSVLYASSGHIGNSGTALVYNAVAVDFLDQTEVTVGGPRTVMRYKFRPVGYFSSEAEFYIYNCHLKAGSSSSDKNTRGIQAANIRANADALGQNVQVIFAGDMNFYGHYQTPSWTEPGWGAFVAEGNARAFDPISRVGNWHKSIVFKDVHTQNPSHNFVGGGMDDRFDFQLVTASLNDGKGVSYIGPNAGYCMAEEESYHAFGNNGTHYWSYASGIISTGTGAPYDILLYLETVSDHLPVVADYQLPARMNTEINTSIPAPGVLVKDSEHFVNVTVSNSAPVAYFIGADRLDYQIETVAGLGMAWAELPGYLSGEDIGSLEIPGQSSYLPETGNIRIVSSGNIGGTADRFHFVHQTVSGDFTFVKRLTEMSTTAGDSRAGIIIRSDVSTSSPFVMMSVSQAGQVQWQHRSVTGGSTTLASGEIVELPIQLKIVRYGNTYSGYFAGDDDQWNLVYSTNIHSYFMSDPVHKGVGAVSGSDNMQCTALFGPDIDQADGFLQVEDMVYALQKPNAHDVLLDTKELGKWATTVRVKSDNVAVADGLSEDTIYYRVTEYEDLTGDGLFSLYDINALLTNIGTHESFYDLNNDGIVSQCDIDVLIHNIMGISYGDLNLDGVVNNYDLQIFSSNWLKQNAAWQHGDSNGNGRVNLIDFARLASQWRE